VKTVATPARAVAKNGPAGASIPGCESRRHRPHVGVGSERQCRHGIALTAPCQECELGVALAACARVLVKLAVLSDVPAMSLRASSDARAMEPRVSRLQPLPQSLVNGSPAGESTVPHGVNQHATIDGHERAPSKHLSLHAHYQWRMLRAQHERHATDLLVLAAEAQRDYDERTLGIRHDATEAEAVSRLLDLRGCSVAVAVAWMRAHGQSRKSAEVWVRRQRILNGYGPEDGEPVAQNGRVARAAALVAELGSMRAAARQLGIVPSTLERMLGGRT
jgi:hypothetical protein